MWIKSTGKRLDEFRVDRAWAEVKLDFLLSQLPQVEQKLTQESSDAAEKAYSLLLKESAIESPGLGQPSMETGFHALLPQPFVIHFHSLAAIVMGELIQSKATLLTWLQHQAPGRDIRFISPLMPGLKLSLELARHPNSDIFLLQNHGVVLQGQDPSILRDWEALEVHFLKEYCPELLSIWNWDFAKISREYARHSAQFRLLFPDAAVFATQLEANLHAQNSTKPALVNWHSSIPNPAQTLNAHERTRLNVFEIWLATVILQQVCPDLTPFPTDLAGHLPNLPTEKIRLGGPHS